MARNIQPHGPQIDALAYNTADTLLSGRSADSFRLQQRTPTHR
jgi:hypothetical protein